MSCQAQSVSALISHLPPQEPPHGPLSSCLAQRAMGQMPPVMPSRQLPQAAQRSAHTPCSTGRPRTFVFRPGTTNGVGIVFGQGLHADAAAEREHDIGLMDQRRGCHRDIPTRTGAGTVTSPTSLRCAVELGRHAQRRAQEFRLLSSPPAKQTVTQVPQPTMSTRPGVAQPISLISSRSFCFGDDHWRFPMLMGG